MAKFTIRRAKREDCFEIRRLIQELADFEKMPEYVKLDAKTLQRDGFDIDKPTFQCIVAEDPEDPSILIGYALFFIGYATWNGNRLYLDDILVTENYRKKGVGKLLFSKVCEAISLGFVFGICLFPLSTGYKYVFNAATQRALAYDFEAVKSNCKVMNFLVLEWNPAVEFYKKIGAEDITNKFGWHVFNLDEEKIKELAKSVSSNI